MKRYHWSATEMIEGERGAYVKNIDAIALEKKYAENLGELARLAEIVCTWALKLPAIEKVPEIKTAANDIMDYVDMVRP